jgi:hypothetical protein
MNSIDPSTERDYIPLADHALIGNLRTAALVSLDGSIESYCIPNFDSPSVFARILDKNKGGHFSIRPKARFSTKQNYLPSSNVLQTKFLNEEGVASVTDFLPRQSTSSSQEGKPFLPWLIRRVEVIRGRVPLRMECAPAFNYAQSPHKTSLVPDSSIPDPKAQPSPNSHQHLKALFQSDGLILDLRYLRENTIAAPNMPLPNIELKSLDLSKQGHLGPAVSSDFELVEGQCVTFVLRHDPRPDNEKSRKPSEDIANEMGVPFETGASKLRAFDDPFLTKELISGLLTATNNYWNSWIRRSTYNGSWKEAVHRSALALKLLIYEPTGNIVLLSCIASFFLSRSLTGAVVASPTFSLPEYIGMLFSLPVRAFTFRLIHLQSRRN